MTTITTRTGKGSPLTNAEVDANFTGLLTALGNKVDKPTTYAPSDLNTATTTGVYLVPSDATNMPPGHASELTPLFKLGVVDISAYIGSTAYFQEITGVLGTFKRTFTGLNWTIWEYLVSSSQLDAKANKATTLSGYGITDGATATSLESKQNLLVSGSNIRMLGGASLVGSGNLTTLNNMTITGLSEVRVDLSTGSAINLASGNLFTKMLTGTTTFTISNVPASGAVAAIILVLTNAGGKAITWWSTIKWAGGTAPTLTTTGVDWLGFITYDGGSTWTGFAMGLDVK